MESFYLAQCLWPQHEHRVTMEDFLNNISNMFNDGHAAR